MIILRELSVAGALTNIKAMRKLAAVLFLLTIFGGKSFCQSNVNKDYFEFGNVLVAKVFNSGIPSRMCKPTVCLIKIDVNSDKSVLNIQFSDSADSVVRKRLNEIKSKIDFTGFTNFIKSENAYDGVLTYIIPLHHTVITEGCQIQTVDRQRIAKMSRFNGVSLIGKVFILDAIDYSEHVIPD